VKPTSLRKKKTKGRTKADRRAVQPPSFLDRRSTRA
jgi:hypothetical protein